MLAVASRGAESKVIELYNDKEYDQVLKGLAATNSAAVIDFSAKWCGPCKMIAPVVEQLAADFPSIKFYKVGSAFLFYKVDIDTHELQATVIANSISAVPTFVAVKGAERLSAFSGADRAGLQRMVLELAEALRSG
eukprot:scaffold5.g848.t1